MKKNILLGVCAGVAIYKSCFLIRELQKEGFLVKVVMTPNSLKLISPVLLQSLASDGVYYEAFKNLPQKSAHIDLSKWTDLMIIAPATANTIAKIACGMADNILTTTVLALPQSTSVLIAPAMNTNMWQNPLTQNNIKILEKWERYEIIGPCTGKLACGDKGIGTMEETKNIVAKVKQII